ncbi:MAG TPA: VOC family protein [Actinomycetota bacterium]|nr:VOC family protein [Actinomycetota bacterium]
MIEIESVASVSAVVRDPGAATHLLRDVIGLTFEGGEDDYAFTEKLPGVRHFGIWPLRDAARACFGSDEWPRDVPVPQASIELEVASVEAVTSAAAELRDKGVDLLHQPKEEPWGQTIVRLLTNDGLILGISFTPWFHG